MPFGLQPIHLVFIVVIALLIFGPKRLPEIGRGVGRAINEFRRGAQEMTEGLKDEISNPAHEAQPAGAGAPVPSMAPPAHATVGMPQNGAAPYVAEQVASGHFCPSCGSSNPAEARFCNKCGSQLPA